VAIERTPRPERGRPLARPGAAAAGLHSAAQLLKLGRAAFYREDEDEALDFLLEALHLAPSNLHIHYLAALCADLLSEEETLDDICSHALEIDQRHPYTVACEAVRYLYLSNYSRAEDLFTRALSMLPDELDLHLGLGILHEYSGEGDKGIAAFQRVLELDPDNVRARMSLGMAYAMSGEYQSALIEYQRAKSIDPSIENPHQRLGRDYYMEGMLEEATSEFGMAISEEPDEPASFFYMMDCHARQGRTDDALDMYEAIRQRFGREPELTSGYYEHFHMLKEAVAALEALAARRPDDAGLRLRLSAAYEEAGDVLKAVEGAEEAARLDPENGQSFATLGRLLFQRGEYRRAIDVCRKAVHINPYDQAAFTTLADAQLFLGRNVESEQTVAEMERNRQEAWRRYQSKFSGQDRADAGF
jgi:pentatricopeptide repeat protein